MHNFWDKAAIAALVIVAGIVLGWLAFSVGGALAGGV